MKLDRFSPFCHFDVSTSKPNWVEYSNDPYQFEWHHRSRRAECCQMLKSPIYKLYAIIVGISFLKNQTCLENEIRSRGDFGILNNYKFLIWNTDRRVVSVSYLGNYTTPGSFAEGSARRDLSIGVPFKLIENIRIYPIQKATLRSVSVRLRIAEDTFIFHCERNSVFADLSQARLFHGGDPMDTYKKKKREQKHCLKTLLRNYKNTLKSLNYRRPI